MISGTALSRADRHSRTSVADPRSKLIETLSATEMRTRRVVLLSAQAEAPRPLAFLPSWRRPERHGSLIAPPRAALNAVVTSARV